MDIERFVEDCVMANRGSDAQAAVKEVLARTVSSPKAVNATMIGLYFLAFFIGNSLVGWVGSFYTTMPTPAFWLMHAGFAAFSGAVFVLFKVFLGPHLSHAVTVPASDPPGP